MPLKIPTLSAAGRSVPSDRGTEGLGNSGSLMGQTLTGGNRARTPLHPEGAAEAGLSPRGREGRPGSDADGRATAGAVPGLGRRGGVRGAGGPPRPDGDGGLPAG